MDKLNFSLIFCLHLHGHIIPRDIVHEKNEPHSELSLSTCRPSRDMNQRSPSPSRPLLATAPGLYRASEPRCRSTGKSRSVSGVTL